MHTHLRCPKKRKKRKKRYDQTDVGQQACPSHADRTQNAADCDYQANNKTAQTVSQSIISVLRHLNEFTLHQTIAQALQAKGFFAHPYHSGERGLNENSNGLVRQYFPKRTDFSEVDDKDITAAMNALKDRPRKCLGWQAPNQVFFGIEPTVVLAS